MLDAHAAQKGSHFIGFVTKDSNATREHTLPSTITLLLGFFELPLTMPMPQNVKELVGIFPTS